MSFDGYYQDAGYCGGDTSALKKGRDRRLYNLLVMHGGWPDRRATFPKERVLEYTSDDIRADFEDGADFHYNRLMRHPCLFMPEADSGDDLGRIGEITRVLPGGGRDVTMEYVFDRDIPPLPMAFLQDMAGTLDIGSFEFRRSHWAAKDVDLYRILFLTREPRGNNPTLFKISEVPNIQPDQLSAMMPFRPEFNAVYRAIQSAGAASGMRVNRGDDIWDHDQIIQDVVSLIDRSKVVVADCTGKNPNVFYEIGIAHTLGRDVILISQSIDDVPFDLRHLRVITYLNNGEGLAALETSLRNRLQKLTG